MGLFNEVINLWAKTNWLKTIKKEQRKLERMIDAVERQRFVTDNLVKEYFKRYPQKPAEGE